MSEIYLDNAATTQVYPQVADRMDEVLREEYYNPSAFYKPSVEVEKSVSAARRSLARVLGARPEEIFFTSGATESNNTVIRGAIGKARGDFNVITSQIEHPSVMNVFRHFESKGVDVRYIPVDGKGRLDLGWLREKADGETALVSVMGANNETGTIMDLPAVGEIVRGNSPKALFHVDFVQAFLKSTDPRLDLKAVKPDAVSITAHKVHGPKGVGALYLKKGARVEPLLLGGGQERGFRSGTENVAGIAGFAAAVDLASPTVGSREEAAKALRERLLNGIADIPDVTVNSPSDGLASLISLSIAGVKAEVLLHMLESKGIYISAGSACSTHKRDSYVHKALGYDKARGEGTIRISTSEFNTPEDMDRLSETLRESVGQLRKITRYKK